MRANRYSLGLVIGVWLALAVQASRASAQTAPPEAPPAATESAATDATPKPEHVETSSPSTAAEQASAKTDFEGGLPLESEVIASDLPKLDFYGFADFNYGQSLDGPGDALRRTIMPFPSFYAGHLNAYINSTLGNNWRALAEVRFSYSPQGNEKPQADGTFLATDSSAEDAGELARTLQWGSIEIQRVWLEYQPLDFLTIRGGQWFTPYGYWNDDHGSPTIITVHKPFPINSQLFPERQTGLQAYGKFFVDSSAIGYFLTLSNGRGLFDAIRDLDNNKALGGRLFVETRLGGELTLGISAYKGRYTASQKRYRLETLNGVPTSVVYRARQSVYDEQSFGADARFLWKNLHLQGEFMLNEVVFKDPYRPHALSFDPASTFKSNYRDMGAYGLIGYRTPFLNVMPYLLVEYGGFKSDSTTPSVAAWTAGLNVRPTPNVVLKAEYNSGHFQGRGSTGVGGQFRLIETQAAWAF